MAPDLIGNAWQMDPIGQNERIESLCVGRDGYTVMIDGRCFEIVVVCRRARCSRLLNAGRERG
jgi:hypothetical protein